MDEASFWQSRAALTHIYDNAARNFASPWHILALAIEGALQQIPWNTTIETNRDYGITPNFAAILYGRTGSGKSSAQVLARSLFDWHTPYTPHGARSGEGIIDSYGEWEIDKLTGDRHFRWTAKGHAQAFIFDEITDFAAKADRSGSTMVGTILSMVTGSVIGGARSGGQDSTLMAQSYRATLTIGGQPGKCGALVSSDAIARGLAGRFLWVTAGIEVTDSAPPRRARKTPVQAMALGDIVWPREIPTAESVLDELHEFDWQNSRADSPIDPIDGHRAMNRLKVAAALAVMSDRPYGRNAGPLEITHEDWELAGFVMDRSDDVRTDAIDAQDSEFAERAAEKGIEKAIATRSELGFMRQVAEYVKKAEEKGFLPGSRPTGDQWRRFRSLFNAKTRGQYMEEVVHQLRWDED